MSDNSGGNNKLVYKVLESCREGGKTRKRHIAFLASYKNSVTPLANNSLYARRNF